MTPLSKTEPSGTTKMPKAALGHRGHRTIARKSEVGAARAEAEAGLLEERSNARGEPTARWLKCLEHAS